MKVYLSGPMTGHADYRKKFKEAEDFMRGQGYTVINPANITFLLPESETTHAEYLYVDYALIDLSDMLFMMNGWKESKGACAELEYAALKGKKIIYQSDCMKMNEEG